MKKPKTIKVLIEVPERWFDIDSPILYASAKIRDDAKIAIREAIIEQYISKVEMPPIKISEKELKDMILKRMADKCIFDSRFAQGTKASANDF